MRFVRHVDHHTGDHQENRRRLLTLCGPNGILRQERFSSALWVEEEIPVVTDADILRVHEFGYLRHLQQICRDLPPQPNTFESSGNLDFDSPLSRKSLDAARQAAGAVCYAVDRIMSDTVRYVYPVACQTQTHSRRNAFVAVRPPGHHAGIFYLESIAIANADSE